MSRRDAKIFRRVISQLCRNYRKEAARIFGRAFARAYKGVPGDHGICHVLQVLTNAVAYAAGYKIPEWYFILLVFAALAHDISDSKFPRHAQRWERFISDIRGWVTPRFITALTLVVDNIGVSKEATSAYTTVFTNEQWDERFRVIGPDYKMILRVRHIVSGADILEATGSTGHWRAVAHHTRRGNSATPEELVKSVGYIHMRKNAKLTQWIHIPAIHQRAIARWDELNSEYVKWAADLGVVVEPIPIRLRGY